MIQVLVTLVVIGVLLWLVETYIPIDPAIKVVIRVVVILFVCLWILGLFGLLGPLPTIR